MATKLRKNNPYSTGYLVKFKNGDSALLRTPLPIVRSERDKIHIVVEGENLTQIAFKYYKDSKYWWVLADVNEIHNPFEPLETSRNIIIPDLDYINAQRP